jgi:phosphatidylethanolamine/phosphatidyl-N-methylethanolamine N-methyltransferase
VTSRGDGSADRPALREHANFLGAFLRSPFRTGAVAPSSRWLAARMVEDAGLASADTVVELGPGTGAITRAIVPELGRDTMFVAVEYNPGFADALRRRFPRATVVNDTAERLPELLAEQGREQVDCILSSLPFAAFPPGLQRRLLDAAVRALAPGGLFVTYAYVPAAWLAPGRLLRSLLNARFERVGTTPIVWRNLPPAFVYRCLKPGGSRDAPAR